jgi:hypothetical protein
MPLARWAVHFGVSRQMLHDIISQKPAVTADIGLF